MGSNRGFETHNIMAVSVRHWNICCRFLYYIDMVPDVDKVGHVVGQSRPPYDILPGEKDIKIMQQTIKDIISLEHIGSYFFPEPHDAYMIRSNTLSSVSDLTDMGLLLKQMSKDWKHVGSRNSMKPRDIVPVTL